MEAQIRVATGLFRCAAVATGVTLCGCAASSLAYTVASGLLSMIAR